MQSPPGGQAKVCEGVDVNYANEASNERLGNVDCLKFRAERKKQ
jgi:hypothetical protein